ncbi:MAG: four helix bundle protein, partial [Deltaproteobacteria bacterium]
MARYEHLPIYREAYDLTVHIEKIVRNFSRYHKYTLGTDLRNKTRAVLEKIIEANNSPDRTEHLMGLRHQLENLKVL